MCIVHNVSGAKSTTAESVSWSRRVSRSAELSSEHSELNSEPLKCLSEYSEPSYELSDLNSEASEPHSKTSGPTSRASELSSEPDQE